MSVTITLPVSDIPDGTTVRRVNGREPCVVKRKLRVLADPADFDGPTPKKKTKPIDAEAGTALLVYPSGLIAAVSKTLEVTVCFATICEARSFLVRIDRTMRVPSWKAKLRELNDDDGGNASCDDILDD